MALTLKFRPRYWSDVVGQDLIVSVLSRQVATRTWKNAYLFVGAAGTGKTTCARILANSINGGEGSPIELDCASNNGVDNIRAIISDAQQSSIDSDYKVYILDEAHMLTTQAWNASLKLIEEPPTHCIFIFCTTNPEKIPETILSRVQRFDFRRVPRDIITDRLEYILNEEGISCYDRASLERIAIQADGHVRDAIQKLEKCLDLGEGRITVDIVETALGLTKTEFIVGILNSMLSADLSECLSKISIIKQSTTDMLSLFNSLCKYSLDFAIYAKCGDIRFTEIPMEYEGVVTTDVIRASMLSERFMEYHKYVNQFNAETFIRAIAVEMAGN